MRFMKAPLQNPVSRCALAALVSSIILAATEAVAGYPHPSPPARMFFETATLTYLPALFFAALAADRFSRAQGLNLWFPLGLGLLRTATSLTVTAPPAPSALAGLVFLALLVLIASRVVVSVPKGPPFLFGLTVGVVLPVLMARVAMARFALRWGGNETALGVGSLAGTLSFVILRSFVARFPQVAPVFLLGPVISLALWSTPPHDPAERSARPAIPATTAAQAPDIVLIVLDTVRADSFFGGPDVEAGMPNLAAFAGRATSFRRAWTTASWL